MQFSAVSKDIIGRRLKTIEVKFIPSFNSKHSKNGSVKQPCLIGLLNILLNVGALYNFFVDPGDKSSKPESVLPITSLKI